MIKKNKTCLIAASIICSNMLNLEADLKELEQGEVDMIHFDVMDGHFVSRLGLYPEVLQSIKSVIDIPADVHLMMENPEVYISAFADAGADVILVPVEGNNNLHRTLKLIKDSGVKAGVTLNPAAPLSVLDYILDDIDMVMLMAINPGVVGHKIIPKVMDKISDLRKKLDDGGHSDILIEIDGGVTFESSPQMVKAGADVLVCGSSTIFKKDEKISSKIKELREEIDKNYG
jgi:ribulose-phosphate 3-epimerase